MASLLQKFLKEKGIATGIHYPVPNHRQPAVEAVYGRQPELPVTEDYCGRILSLPVFPDITEEQIRTVAAAIADFLTGNRG